MMSMLVVRKLIITPDIDTNIDVLSMLTGLRETKKLENKTLNPPSLPKTTPPQNTIFS
jgi:hypothetical protein